MHQHRDRLATILDRRDDTVGRRFIWSDGTTPVIDVASVGEAIREPQIGVADHPGKALSRDRLLTLTRNREWDPFDRSVDIRVARLRRKLESGTDGPGVIRTVRGVGYMYVPAAS